MATKVKLMKFLQEMRGFAEITRRHPSPKTSVLYMMQLRSHVAETSQSKRKLTITVELKETHELPLPVKITHVKPASPEVV